MSFNTGHTDPTWLRNAKANKRESGFWETFRECPVVDEWALTLYNYFMLGIPPGSFFRAVFANNLFMAAARSHPANRWEQIMELAKWIQANAPVNSVGSFDNVDAWQKMSEEDRNKILSEKGWRLNDEQLAWKLVSEPHYD